MAGMLRLEEKHKRAVELVIRGIPREQICAELDISRSTLHNWMRDPLVQAYYERLVSELELARRTRMLPSVLGVLDLFDAAVKEEKRRLDSSDAKERMGAASLATIAKVLSIIHQLESTDAGRPSQITELQTVKSTGEPRKRTALEVFLDGVVEIEAGPTTKPEEKPE